MTGTRLRIALLALAASMTVAVAGAGPALAGSNGTAKESGAKNQGGGGRTLSDYNIQKE